MIFYEGHAEMLMRNLQVLLLVAVQIDLSKKVDINVIFLSY